RRYQLDVSPPYFIPAPVVPWSIGTMGAFIRLRTVVSDRRQLLDVGVAGPIAGLLVAVPALVIGFALSHPAAAPASLNGMVLGLDDGQAVLGDSVLTFALRHLVRGSASALVLHPVAFAGWLGVFVTMLNLLPISQLDGGHILYSAVPRWHRRTALGFWALIVALGVYWRGWLLWGGLVLLLSLAPRSPAGAGRAPAAAAVAPRARMDCAHSFPHHVHADTFSTLRAGERPVKGRGRGKGPFPFPPPLTGRSPAVPYCVSITGLYLWTNQPYGDACPDNRHDTRVPIHPTQSSTTFPPSDSTDNSSPYVSWYAAPRTG